MKEYLMGNAAIAAGALAAGVNLVSGYPGTPSSEIIETISKREHSGIHLEWSVNEKAALEVAAAASYAGARTLVTMKQVGLNVASDPLMSLAYVGVKGGMVIVSADDPGPISSQTEQDTRRFADFCRIPVFDPSSVEEAYHMIGTAFDYSEKYKTPVLFRPTTRICHAYAAVDTADKTEPKKYEGFIKDSSRWVIFPRLSKANHAMIEKRNILIGDDFSVNGYNSVSAGSSKKAIITSGVSYSYCMEYLKNYQDIKLIKIANAYPFPEKMVYSALSGVDEILCVEELSPFIEEQVLKLLGRYHLDIKVRGKLDETLAASGEYDASYIAGKISEFLGNNTITDAESISDAPALPQRPPVLCAGCPHRGSFYAVKAAMKKLKKKGYYCGDIGCYTLGNAMPLDMCDTCLCMGAGVTMAQGFNWVDKEGVAFAFIGDSTFFASGITGVVNAVYNEADMILCVLDNSTTAMTGHQPHPGTGRNMMGNIVDKIDIARVLEGLGVKKILTVDPLKLKESVDAVCECVSEKGVKAIIFKSPCIAITKPTGKMKITEKCIKCRKCIKEIGCPALIMVEDEIRIDENLCTGCGYCSQLCTVQAIVDAGGI